MQTLLIKQRTSEGSQLLTMDQHVFTRVKIWSLGRQTEQREKNLKLETDRVEDKEAHTANLYINSHESRCPCTSIIIIIIIKKLYLSVLHTNSGSACL